MSTTAISVVSRLQKVERILKEIIGENDEIFEAALMDVHGSDSETQAFEVTSQDRAKGLLLSICSACYLLDKRLGNLSQGIMFVGQIEFTSISADPLTAIPTSSD